MPTNPRRTSFPGKSPPAREAEEPEPASKPLSLGLDVPPNNLEEPSPEEFARRLRLALEAKGISVSNAARIAGIPRARISAYCNGRVAPSSLRLIGLVNALDLDLAILFGEPT